MKYILLFLFFPLACIAQDSLVVHFELNKDQLNPQEAIKLKKSLVGKNISIDRIIGSTDSLGNQLYNLDLSLRRARNIKALLDSLMPNSSKNAEFQGIGELPTGNLLDRKVVIYYQQKADNLSSQINTAKVGDKITLKNLNFEPGQDVLLPSSEGTIRELLEIMKANPKLKIAIEGHICCSEEDDRNLSGLRAKVVHDYLLNNQIKSSRISYKGYGSKRPIYPLPEKTEAERISNRRVEVRILSTQ